MRLFGAFEGLHGTLGDLMTHSEEIFGRAARRSKEEREIFRIGHLPGRWGGGGEGGGRRGECDVDGMRE